MALKFISFFLVALPPLCMCTNHFQETFVGVVGGGNYTYYFLPHPGTVVLYLNTLKGDADLYVSSKNQKPTFDVENHELQSTSCGAEQLRISSAYERPLSIAVYGHPSHDLSFYELTIDIFDPHMDTEADSQPEFHEPKKALPKPTSPPSLSDKDDKDYEEQSVFWTMFLRVLQVLLDLLVD